MANPMLTRVDWQPQRALRAVDGLAREATERGGQHLLDAANRHVPYETGELAESGEASAGEDGSVIVGYTADHARPVRARGRALHGRSARWLDEAMTGEADAVGRLIGDTIKSGWPSG